MITASLFSSPFTSQWMPYILAVGFGMVQFFLGLMLGRWWTERELGVGKSKALSINYLRKLLGKLAGMTTKVANEVIHYHARIDTLTDRLKELQDEGNPRHSKKEVNELTLEVIAEMIQTNKQLNQRLLSAEQKLEIQTLEIADHASRAMTDPLTALANRRALQDELLRQFAHWQRRKTALSVIILDIDHFKIINDTHGHLAGDAILKQVASILKQTARTEDLVTRFGGEEFAMVLPSTQQEDAQVVAERVRKAIENKTFQHQTTKMDVTISVGVAEINETDDLASLLKRADIALYASKHAGRNCCHFHNGAWCEPLGILAKNNSDTLPDVIPHSATIAQKELLSSNESTMSPELSEICDNLRRHVSDVVTESVK